MHSLADFLQKMIPLRLVEPKIQLFQLTATLLEVARV